MLKNPIAKLAFFFDLEWVPDAKGAVRLYDLPSGTTELEAMQELWVRCPQYDAEKNPRPFLKYMLSRVVSIAFLSREIVYRDGEETVQFGLYSLPSCPVESADIDEANIIDRFLEMLGRNRPQLVGYNSSESDIQVLIQRGIINELSAPEFCRRPQEKYDKTNDYFTRWDNECHLDLLKFFSGYGMQPRLDDFAKLCGFPGKIDVKGDQVTDLWLARDCTKIVEYNMIDTLNTYLLWLRFVYFIGRLTEEKYFLELEEFRAFLEAEAARPDRAFISDFLNKWPE